MCLKALGISALAFYLLADAHANAFESGGPPLDPKLQIVTTGPRVPFVRGDGDCPNATVACTLRAYLVPGDPVVVTESRGDYVLAHYIGGRPGHRRLSQGWLPRASLANPPPQGAPINWRGIWTANGNPAAVSQIDKGLDAGAYIRITTGSDGRLVINGNGCYFVTGSHDDLQAHLAPLEGKAAPQGNTVTFRPVPYGDADSDPNPVDGFPPRDANQVVVRMWQLGPYLVVDPAGSEAGYIARYGFDGLFVRSDD